MQVHLYMCLIIERKMRENGENPDKEPEAPTVLESAADFAAFFG